MVTKSKRNTSIKKNQKKEPDMSKLAGHDGSKLNLDNDPLKIQIGGHHYLTEGIQPVAFFMSNPQLSYCQCAAMKYIFRLDNKSNNFLMDATKAKHYLDLHIALTRKDSNG